MNPRYPLLAAGLFGATGVGFGAFGAHLLRASLLAQGTLETWENRRALPADPRGRVAGRVRLAADRPGTGRGANGRPGRSAPGSPASSFFSGSLYLLAAGGPHWLGPVTPLGGLALIAGWFCVAAAAMTDATG